MDERRCTSRSSSRHRTSRYSSSRESGVRWYCFALCVDVRLYRQDSVMFTLAARTYVYTCHIRWLAIRCPSRLNRGAAQMQFQRFRRATVKSRCDGNVTKMCTGPFESRRVLTAFPFCEAPAISDANSHGLPARRMNYAK